MSLALYAKCCKRQDKKNDKKSTIGCVTLFTRVEGADVEVVEVGPLPCEISLWECLDEGRVAEPEPAQLADLRHLGRGLVGKGQQEQGEEPEGGHGEVLWK